MNKSYMYIWYPLTSYYHHNNEDINFKISEKISPYLELNNNSFNSFEDNTEIELNPYYRFSKEIQDLLSPELYNLKGKVIDKFLNINFHLLGEIDLYIGQNKKDIYVKEIIKGIECGDLGEYLKVNIQLFKGYEKHIIADILYELYTHLNMINSFKKVIKLLFPDSIFYDNLSSKNNLILYLNYTKNENKERLNVIKKIFYPIGLDIDIFWEVHFGVIGVPITMKIGEVSIY